MLDFGRAALYNKSYLLDSACRVQREVTLCFSVHYSHMCADMISMMQLPKRLARRLMDLQFLPYIVVTNPHIKRVYDSYQHAFDTLQKLPKVRTVEENSEFTILLKRLVDEHGERTRLSPCTNAHDTFGLLLVPVSFCCNWC